VLPLSVDQHGAGAAPTFAAAAFRAGELQVFAQHLEQRPLGVGCHRARLTVHGEQEGLVYRSLRLRCCSEVRTESNPAAVGSARKSPQDFRPGRSWRKVRWK